MPVLISFTRASSKEASFCSTIFSTIPTWSRIMRPYPAGFGACAVRIVALAFLPWWYSNKLFNVSVVKRGVSPLITSVVPFLPSKNWAACMTACPVPSCWACKAYSLRVPNCSFTISAPWPTMVMISCGCVSSTRFIICSTIGFPQTGCKTLYNFDFMRVPLPAAKIIP